MLMNLITINMNLLQNTNNCAICLEELTIPCRNSCITECEHVFHLNCLIRNTKHNTRCPICRKDILIRELHNHVLIRQNTNIYLKYYLIICLIVLLYYIFQGVQNNGYEDSYDRFEEISIENQLYDDIKDIVSSITRIENNKIQPVINQIKNVCIQFGNRTLNYIRNIFQYDIDYLKYDINHFHFKIVQIVNNTANISLEILEKDIRNLCFEYTESILFDIM